MVEGLFVRLWISRDSELADSPTLKDSMVRQPSQQATLHNPRFTKGIISQRRCAAPRFLLAKPLRENLKLQRVQPLLQLRRPLRRRRNIYRNDVLRRSPEFRGGHPLAHLLDITSNRPLWRLTTIGHKIGWRNIPNNHPKPFVHISSRRFDVSAENPDHTTDPVAKIKLSDRFTPREGRQI